MSYRLTELAAQDLVDIIEYTIVQWGIGQGQKNTKPLFFVSLIGWVKIPLLWEAVAYLIWPLGSGP